MGAEEHKKIDHEFFKNLTNQDFKLMNGHKFAKSGMKFDTWSLRSTEISDIDFVLVSTY